MGQYPRTERSIKNITIEVNKMCASYIGLCGHMPEFDDVDKMLTAVLDRVKDPSTRVLCRSIRVLGLTRADAGGVNVMLSFPTKFITSFEYRKPGEEEQ